MLQCIYHTHKQPAHILEHALSVIRGCVLGLTETLNVILHSSSLLMCVQLSHQPLWDVSAAVAPQADFQKHDTEQ